MPALEDPTDTESNTSDKTVNLDETNSSDSSIIDQTIIDPETVDKYLTPNQTPAPKKTVHFQDIVPQNQTQIDQIFKQKLLPPQLDPRIRALQQEYRDPNSSTDSFHSADSTPAQSGTVTPLHVRRELTLDEIKQEKARQKEVKRLQNTLFPEEDLQAKISEKEEKKQAALQKKLLKQGINEMTTGLENFPVENPLIRPSRFTRSATATFRESFPQPSVWGKPTSSSKEQSQNKPP